ncbi:gfo/Idh/MocA family oxidoreductase [candidate division KSB1 bacterium]|nr:Gfo/Idh/MocA family oxidoreductase [candidate division KSB1 bacterium]RQW04169.1 MAG: gfo/Idh/MocA family oxidoreductase [candidate division KSB1 bacterium]
MKTSIYFAVCFCVFLTTSAWPDVNIKVGLIGLDTSHAPAFTKILNDSSYRHHMPGARVVAAFPGGSPDVEASFSRVEKFTREVASYQVEIVEDIPSLLTKVDAVILTSVDGRVHLQQVKPVIAAKKPVFIDKPMAASLADVEEIFRLANEANVACFSASSLRFFPELQEALNDTSLGMVTGCDAYSPASLEPHHPDLMWYGVHGIEILFAAMGAECESLSRTFTPGTDMVVGLWTGGRIGTFRGIRDGKGRYGATIFFENGMRHVEPDTGLLYVHLMAEILTFFRTGNPPIPQEETIAMFAFMEGADISKAQDGARVRIQ